MEDKKTAPSNIDEYIDACRPEIRDTLREIRCVIRETAPDATERISYRMPTFEQNGPLVYFAAFAKHIGFYPLPDSIETFAEDLAPYKTSTGAVQFPIDKEIPYDLIRRITAYRLAKNLEKGEEEPRRTKKS
jgi:uncharacterized protein YdhG (YjbR/CyaY superfamily)